MSLPDAFNRSKQQRLPGRHRPHQPFHGKLGDSSGHGDLPRAVDAACTECGPHADGTVCKANRECQGFKASARRTDM